MAKRRKTNHPKTLFIKRILKLQEEHGYTDQQVIDNVKCNGQVLTEYLQTYGKWKSGERLPQNLTDAIVAFADFYRVSTDYLLKPKAPKTPKIGYIEKLTGLSDTAANSLMTIKRKYPDVAKMLNVLLADASGEGITFFVNLYNQIYSDYKDTISKTEDSVYDLDKMERRFLKTQHAYNYISAIVQRDLENELHKQYLQEQAEYSYYHSDEYINSLPNCTNDDYDLEYEDGTVVQLRAERH